MDWTPSGKASWWVPLEAEVVTEVIVAERKVGNRLVGYGGTTGGCGVYKL